MDFAVLALHLLDWVNEVRSKPGVSQNLDLSPLEKTLKSFIEEQISQHTRSYSTNQARNFEQNWLTHEGIPGRPWFKHLLYASRFTYAHLEIPGLTEAIERSDWKIAAQEAEKLRLAIEKNKKLFQPPPRY